MFKVEIEDLVVMTATISDEDEKKMKEYIKNNPDKFQRMSDKEKIIKALSDMDGIDLYRDIADDDCSMNDIRWSGCEKCSAEEILSRQ